MGDMSTKQLILMSLFLLTCLVGFVYRQQVKINPTYADVRYGKFDRNVFDFWETPTATKEKPAPLLVYYHGGGWLDGDKGAFNPKIWLQHGVSVASVNYRFTKGHKDAAPYPAPMQDSARALQYIRSNARGWNIDPERIVISGSSAGAVIALWIGLQDDMKNLESKDPIERISTRVNCLLPVDAPTTLNPKLIAERIGGSPKIHPALLPFFGTKSLEALEEPEFAEKVAAADPFTYISADDPPTYCLFNLPMTETPLPADADVNISIHHPEFGVYLKEKLEAVDVECEVQWKGDGKNGSEAVLWVLDKLGMNKE